MDEYSDSSRRLPGRVRARHWARRLILSGWDYTKTFYLEKRLEPVRFMRRVWELGWGTRAVFLALLTSAVVAGLLLDRERLESSPDRSALNAMLLVLFGLAWATAAATAASLGRAAGIAILAWLAHTGILSMAALARTPWMAMPVLWSLGLGWRLIADEPVRGQFIKWWTALALVGGYLTSGPSGFREALGLSPWSGRFILAGAYGVLGGLARARLPDRWRCPPSWEGTLAGSAALIGFLLVIAWHKDPALTVAWMPDLMMFIEPVVSLFWLWTGAGFIFGTWKLIDFGTRRIARLNLTRVGLAMVPAAWVLGLGLEWFVVHGSDHLMSIPEGLFRRLQGPIVKILNAPMPVAWACEWHIGITVGVIGVAVVARMRGPVRARWLMGLTGMWIASFAGLVAVMATRLKIYDIARGADVPVGALALTGMAATLVFELARIAKDWEASPPVVVQRQLGWMMVAGAIICTAHIARGERARVEEGLMVLHGMLFFGAIRAVYSRHCRGTPKDQRLPDFHQAVMALSGIFTGWVVLAASPTDWRCLLFGLPLWILILLGLRRRRPDWNAAAGAMAGAMLACGALYYWVMPFPLNIPFIGDWFMLDVMRHLPWKNYPDAFLFQLIGGCALLGALPGYAIFKRR